MYVQVGQQVQVQEDDKQAPFNGAVGTVVEVVANVDRPYAVVELYGRTYRFSDLDLVVVAE
jgi:rRNA processing protein Gar1